MADTYIIQIAVTQAAEILWGSSMKTLNCICLTLTIIGAIVWGIIGLFSYNLVDGIFGSGTAFSRIIYTLVGVAGLYTISFYWLMGRDA